MILKCPFSCDGGGATGDKGSCLTRTLETEAPGSLEAPCLTFHRTATSAKSRRIPAMTLPTMTPVGTSAFSWGFVIVMGICQREHVTRE